MHPKDKCKTAFMTELSCYCYTVMPFGLKNAGATYQRLMDRLLAPMIGRNVQAYVDDMVVTSQVKDQHVANLEELFTTIAKYRLKLNPEKCVFGVEAGNSWDRGEPREVRCNPRDEEPDLSEGGAEVDTLCLDLYQSKEEKQVHLDQGVRGGTPQAEGILGQSPVLCKPQLGTPLRLYFTVTERTISLVLMQEQDQVQKPIYFVSKVLQGPEVRYQALEKAALAMVFSARRLHHYFQSFTVVVMTYLPIHKVL